MLFALAVTSLHDKAVPLVVNKLQALTAEEKNELLDLIKDVNPVSGAIHTFPRIPQVLRFVAALSLAHLSISLSLAEAKRHFQASVPCQGILSTPNPYQADVRQSPSTIPLHPTGTARGSRVLAHALCERRRAHHSGRSASLDH